MVCVSPNCNYVLVHSKEYLSHFPQLCLRAGGWQVRAVGLVGAPHPAVQASGTQTDSLSGLGCPRGVRPAGFRGAFSAVGGASGTGPKPPLTAGARLTTTSPSLKAQRALAFSPLERAIFVFHLQKLCSKIKETSLRRRTNDQCLQLRREQVTISSTTRTVTITPAALGWASRCPRVPHLVLHPLSSLCAMPLHTLHGTGFVAMVTSKSHDRLAT